MNWLKNWLKLIAVIVIVELSIVLMMMLAFGTSVIERIF